MSLSHCRGCATPRQSTMNQKRNIKFLEKKEIDRIINTIPDDLRGLRDRALLSVLFSTGLRIGEALKLMRNVMLAEDAIRTLELSIIGKGNWQRTVYISPVALKAVLRYFAARSDDDDRVFPITIRCAQKMVKQRAKEAGVNKFISPHVFRHSFATNLLRRGANIYYVQQFLGHRSLSSTQEYLHVVNSDLIKIHKEIYGSDK